MACRDCFRGGIHTHATPVGYMTTVNSTTCYISPGTNKSHSTTSTITDSHPPLDFTKSHILYLSDGFGLALVNNKLLADRYAAETGLTVIAPDVPPGGGLHTDALALTDTISDPVAWTNLWGQLARIWAVIQLVPIAIPFVLKNRQRDAAKDDIIAFGRWLRSEMAAAGGKAKLGAAGFCYVRDQYPSGWTEMLTMSPGRLASHEVVQHAS
jgi:hypothetical protein